MMCLGGERRFQEPRELKAWNAKTTNVVAAIGSAENANAQAISRPGAAFHAKYFSRKFAPSSRAKMNHQDDQTKVRQLNICGEKIISVEMALAAILLQFAI